MTRDDAGEYRATGLSRRYGGALALDGVDFVVRPSEVVALLGGNGAGKSTLTRLLTGVERPDHGHLELGGERIEFDRPSDARRAGIAVVHQHAQLFADLSVEQNVVLSPIPRRAGVFVDRRAMRRRTEELCARVGVDLDPTARVSSLDPAGRKTVEILRALAADPRFLFLDEPTAALEPRETERLFEVMQRLRAGGTGVVFITHRLAEVMQVADRAVSLRDGRLGEELGRADYSHDALVRMVTGGIVETVERPGQPAAERLRAEFTGIRLARGAEPFDLAVRAGEIVTAVGLVGSGVEQLIGGLVGSGRGVHIDATRIDGRPVHVRTPADAIRAGVAFVPGDRADSSLPSRSVLDNYILPWLRRYASAGVLRPARAREAVLGAIDAFSVKTPSPDAPIAALSGGNQQKVLIARWMRDEVAVLVLNEPTQGVDVKARAQIHASLIDFVAAGGAIIMATSDLLEATTLSHRMLVLHNREVTARYDHPDEIPDVPGITRAMTALPPSTTKDSAWPR